MVTCAAYGCHNRSVPKVAGISFHRFPGNEIRRQQWIEATRRKDWTPTKHTFLCSVHFEEEFIDRTSVNSTRLRENAVPTIFHGFPSHMQKITKKRETLNSSKDQSNVVPVVEASMLHENDIHVDMVPATTEKSAEPTLHVTADVAAVSRRSIETSAKLLPSMKRRLSILQKKCEQQRRKIKTLQQVKLRSKKKIVNLRQMLVELKNVNLIQHENYLIFNSFNESVKELLQRQVTKVKKGKLQRKYPAPLRKFALTVNFLSPKAYNYIRSVFDTCLPHPRTLSAWYSVVNGSPGFTEEALNTLKLKASVSRYPLVCSLAIDEMAIRKQLEWDGRKYHGYADVGESDGEFCPELLAKEALVFMLICINDSWKLPIGYFLVNSLNGENKHNLVVRCIDLLIKCNVKVVSITFDGATSNTAMLKSFNCSLQESYSLSATIGNSKIWFFYDPCHMLKLIRNTFGEKKVLVDSSGGVINWQYIEELHKLQEIEGLHLGNKLRSSHVNFSQQKMKVKLAAQLLSDSVADAITFCNNKLHLTQFKNCEATVQFIKHVNNAFDILNSTSLQAPYFKKALNLKNINEVRQYINVVTDYFKQLKFIDGQYVIFSNRKTGFTGMISALNNASEMFHDLVENNNLLKYLPLYKVNQDHVELFFSSIRSRLGNNNNPTARQFQAAYKKLLVRAEIREYGLGNCIPIEEISILNCAALKKPEELINISLPRYQMFDDIDNLLKDGTECEALDDHDYLADGTLSVYSSEVIKYISGYIVKSLRSSLKCDSCLNSLINKQICKGSLIHLKSKGGLINPSLDMIRIVKRCEIVFRGYVAMDTIYKPNSSIRFSNEILKYFYNINIFSCLKSHILEHGPMNNHIGLLIRSISTKYFNIRINYLCKRKNLKGNNELIRTKLTKLILFKGQ